MALSRTSHALGAIRWCSPAPFSDSLMEATLPFKLAPQAGAGADALAQAVRFITDDDPNAVILSLDGIGAYDHTKRAAMLTKLKSLPEANRLLPFTPMFYGGTSTYLWTNGAEETIERRLIVPWRCLFQALSPLGKNTSGYQRLLDLPSYLVSSYISPI